MMISIDKVTVNIGVGAPGEKLEKAKKLLETITGQKPVETKGKKRIPTWGVRKQMPIGVKVTLRGKKAKDFLDKCFNAIDKELCKKNFSDDGNFSFGIKEYINVPEFKYDAEIGIFGFDVCVSMTKWGGRIRNRKRKRSRIPAKHLIKKEEVMTFLKEKFDVEIVEKKEERW